MQAPQLGIKANLAQFSLLVAVNAFVGSMVGLERTVLPLLASEEFGVASTSATLSFLVAFGVVKALTNLAAGRLADRIGRKPLLVAGWVAALPVAPMIIWAPAWGWIVAANVLLGINQGLAWSATVIMKIDLAGPARRGFAMGLNEVAGYGAVAVVAWVTGLLASTYGPRPAPFVLGIGIAVTGLALSAFVVRETHGHAKGETGGQSQRPSFMAMLRERSLGAVCVGGLVNNLNDGMIWGLVPLYLSTSGLSIGRIGVIAALYPGSWGLAQLATGAASDRTGRKPLIVGGLLLQSAGIAALVLTDAYGGWIACALAMGLGTALVYPTLLAAVGDVAHPSWRASAVGVYRLWRDLGYAAGALVAGALADAAGMEASILAVAAITAAGGLFVGVRMRETLSSIPPALIAPVSP